MNDAPERRLADWGGQAAKGPWVQAAAICENVIEDKQGVLTLVRLVDRITLTVQGDAPPESMPLVTLDLRIVVALKSGDAHGEHTIAVDMVSPDGSVREGPLFDVTFVGEEAGQNVVLSAAGQFRSEGLYWFNVWLDERELLTRVPLRIVYAPEGSSLESPSDE